MAIFNGGSIRSDFYAFHFFRFDILLPSASLLLGQRGKRTSGQESETPSSCYSPLSAESPYTCTDYNPIAATNGEHDMRSISHPTRPFLISETVICAGLRPRIWPRGGLSAKVFEELHVGGRSVTKTSLTFLSASNMLKVTLVGHTTYPDV